MSSNVSLKIGFKSNEDGVLFLAEILQRLNLPDFEECIFDNLNLGALSKLDIIKKIIEIRPKKDLNLYKRKNEKVSLLAIYFESTDYWLINYSRKLPLDEIYQMIEFGQCLALDERILFCFLFDEHFNNLQGDRTGFYHRIYNMEDRIPPGTPKDMIGYTIDTKNNYGRTIRVEDGLDFIPSWFNLLNIDMLKQRGFYNDLITFLAQENIQYIQFGPFIQFLLFHNIEDCWLSSQKHLLKGFHEIFVKSEM